eukprot:5684297-Karenia_brevis.AAC.1
MGYWSGFWHVSCGILASKQRGTKNALVPITGRVAWTWSGANQHDAPVIDRFISMDLDFLRAALRV